MTEKKYKSLEKKAIEAINRDGVILVFPINNKPEPHSLWSELHPNKEMRWDWDVTGDNKVVDLWHLKTELSKTRKVVYSKWFRGRATYFSRDLFAACLRFEREYPHRLSRDSENLLSTLVSDSPLSTKQLKALTELQGKMFEAQFNRSMKPLWERFKIVAYGEFEDSSFPSLGLAATQTLFEDLLEESDSLTLNEAQFKIKKAMPEGSPFFKFWNQIFKN
ncbi:MAG: hypothetical protein ACK5V3_18330 [Bdellovibrionales bacterium]